MANPSTATRHSSTDAVDEAVRIANQSAHRTTENAQAAVAFGRTYLDQTSRLTRDVLALWTASLQAGLQTAFDAQNAAITTSHSLLETSFGFSKNALARGVDIAHQAQATTLKSYQATTRLAQSLTTDSSL